MNATLGLRIYPPEHLSIVGPESSSLVQPHCWIRLHDIHGPELDPPRARSSPRQASSNAVPMTAARTAARSKSRWPPESETMEWFQNPPADESDWQADPARARHLRSGPIAPVDQHGAKDPSAAGTRPGKALSRQRGPPLSDTTLRSRQARSTRWGSYCLKDTAGDSPRRSRSPTPARPRW